MTTTDIKNFLALANSLCQVLIDNSDLLKQVSNQINDTNSARWQTFLKEYAVTDPLCAASYKWHNVRIAMYIKAMEDSSIGWLHYGDRTGKNASHFYQQLSAILGYNINRHSVESQINHFHENDKNQHAYLTEILPLVRTEAQKK